MRSEINYHWGDENLLIDLGNRLELRAKVMLWSEFLFTTSLAAIFLLKAFPVEKDLWNVFACLGAVVLLLLATYRFLSRMYSTEKLQLKPYQLQIVTRSPFSYKVHEYDWEYIGPLHYVGQHKEFVGISQSTKSDYLGFELYKKLTRNLNSERNLFFNYDGSPVRFGKSVSPWDAEEVVNMMRLYKGDKIILGPEWDAIMQDHELVMGN